MLILMINRKHPTTPQIVFSFIMEYLFLLMFGGIVYYGIEILYRGYSHVSMFFVGGLCFIFIGLINEIFEWTTPLWKQILIGDIIVLIVEFWSGVVLNKALGLNVWDYSDLPLNLYGQICLPFAILWLPIVLVAIVVDDWLRYLLFRGSKPRYKLR